MTNLEIYMVIAETFLIANTCLQYYRYLDTKRKDKINKEIARYEENNNKILANIANNQLDIITELQTANELHDLIRKNTYFKNK